MSDGVRKVILNAAEQRALAWLLHATDNGQIIAGSELPMIMRLSGIAKRLGRSTSEHLLKRLRRDAELKQKDEAA